MANRPANAGTHSVVLAWLPYLIVLAGVAVGLYVAWRGSQHAGRGAAVVGGALLAAAAARLVLPPRYAGPAGVAREGAGRGGPRGARRGGTRGRGVGCRKRPA